MPRERSKSEKAAGKLISAIQKIWGEQAGEPEADLSEEVMNRAHILLQAREPLKMKDIIGSYTLNQFLGEIWLQKHANIKRYVKDLETEIYNEKT